MIKFMELTILAHGNNYSSYQAFGMSQEKRSP